jgi:sugar phosphate permease
MLGAATARVPERDQGAAAGLINTSQQIGGAVGVAVLLTIASARTDAATGAAAQSLLAGYHAAFVVGVGLTLLAAVIALFALAGTSSPTQTPEGNEPHDPAATPPPRSDDEPNQGGHP